MTAVTRTEAPVVIEGDGLEVRVQELGGGMSVAFIKLPQGTDMAPALKGLPDDLCQCPHWGQVLSGRLRMRTKDGEDFYEAGQVYYWAPGHSPEALEDVEVVEFSPTKEFLEVMEHIQ
ncbi:hypothetical protein [Streptomyces caniscabiei]|uniref:Cupin domain-containing protein n=1 Tax=Streptomyces caniscabiei TaxID=2746961 RepID=A0A927QGA4_9ACTN|nr:hypothetical protein [Streptomyces caniscabiei]MBD9701705.1 hypothetical protein [Streptomyces caniscabiei]MBD9724560.1 hypothetical protein [Streptomyces caniscabiei]MDX3507973.1 hypothetical protein [Streptomyces caniscabiei]MDX3717935.1 hypothetical protein [Streptomyces caniscabiei]MDX3726401.1 hypothetical protein [Streptomyces caniscabiei]